MTSVTDISQSFSPVTFVIIQSTPELSGYDGKDGGYAWVMHGLDNIDSHLLRPPGDDHLIIIFRE